MQNVPIESGQNLDPLGNVTQFGIQLGLQNALKSSQVQSLNRWFSFSHLRYYFDVTHSYVLCKLLLILFPFSQKKWQRSPSQTATNGFKSAREDLNAPDMYIPVMAFITYVMLAGLISGIQKGRFQPELLWMTGSTALIFSMCEVMFVKTGCYLLGIQPDTDTPSVSILDLLSMSGYKFVPVVVCQLIGLVSSRLKWILFVGFCISLAFFVLRSLRRIVGSGTIDSGKRRKRVHFLFGVALLQSACSYLMLKWSFS